MLWGALHMDDRSNPPTKDDVLAILKAHRDLGPEFDSHLADQIMDLLSPRKNRLEPQERTRQTLDSRRERFRKIRIIPVMVLSIPILTIAGHYGGKPGVFAVLAFDALAVVLSMVFG